MASKVRVTLHDVHFTAMEYFDWLVTGLQFLHEAGEIDFTLHTTATTAPFRLHPKVYPAVRRLAPGLAAALARGLGGVVTGTVESGDRKTRFVFDVGDSPFAILPDLLTEHDLYFKAQCPASLDPRGYPIARDCWVPYHPDVLAYQERIRPAMLGRPLSRTLNPRKNAAVLRQWQERGQGRKDVALLAYFGSDSVPPPRGPEGVVMTRFAGKVHHPNVKRGQLVEGLRQRYRTGVDARIVATDQPQRRGQALSDGTFHALAGSAWHNVNVSGFRRSLPFRFVDSFLVGAAVPTDELGVRWYQPLEEGTEVFDLGPMGYERAEDVDWERVWTVLDRLHGEAEAVRQERKKRIAERFERLWHPRALARYVVGEATRGW